jgi:hypothetical protein
MPSLVGALRYLQTFCLEDCYGMKIPNVFWKLKRLNQLLLVRSSGYSEIKLRLDGLSIWSHCFALVNIQLKFKVSQH